ncbi:MAG: translocation/assembly module TamB domain-containing protein, partial [Lishizhenia sp.]
DEEGHTGSIVGQVFHDNFSNFNFDLSFNLQDDAVNRDNNHPFKILPLEKFLVMNTTYKEGDIYYGKAYVTGTANISGYADNMEITVDVKSEKGTWVDFPMYGASEITEENFIVLNPDKSQDSIKEQALIDFTGVDLNLNITATPDARLKLIFDENVGDEITAYGSGDLEIKLDNFGDLAMEGIYKVEDGVYNFAMGPYKQNFYIQPGGTVQWTGNPYEATLDLAAFYKTTANISAVMNEVIDGRSNDNEEIYCYLNMQGEMAKPNISFDIQAPKASESGKAVINRIRSEQDELNRQFFSLMIAKRFQPLNSQLQVGGGGALDLLSTQINSLLSAVSTDYKLNVALDSDELTGDNSYELGVSKGFLDDRLIVSGSFGVENRTNENAAQTNNFIGDVSIEYLLNESGNFRVNVFNESNDYSIIQDNNVGQFTQGVGLQYQEEFQNLGDFKLFQYIADVFRTKKNKKYNYSEKKKLKPIPEEYKQNPGKLEKEIQELK